jgi:type II secretory pathway pseudopilin PulG
MRNLKLKTIEACPAKLQRSGGFTLIETIIYIALFSFLVGNGFLITYQLMQGGDKLNTKSINQEEINFVLRKLNWILDGVSIINTPSSGFSNNLTITKYDGTVWGVRLETGKIEIREGVGSYLPITTSNVSVTTLQFQLTSPTGIIASTTINGFVASTTKYIRK